MAYRIAAYNRLWPLGKGRALSEAGERSAVQLKTRYHPEITVLMDIVTKIFFGGRGEEKV